MTSASASVVQVDRLDISWQRKLYIIENADRYMQALINARFFILRPKMWIVSFFSILLKPYMHVWGTRPNFIWLFSEHYNQRALSGSIYNWLPWNNSKCFGKKRCYCDFVHPSVLSSYSSHSRGSAAGPHQDAAHVQYETLFTSGSAPAKSLLRMQVVKHSLSRRKCRYQRGALFKVALGRK